MEGKERPSCDLNEVEDRSLQFDGSANELESNEVIDWLEEFSREVAEYAIKESPKSSLKSLKDRKNERNEANRLRCITLVSNDLFVKPNCVDADNPEAAKNVPFPQEEPTDYSSAPPTSPSDFENAFGTEESITCDANMGIYKTPRSRVPELPEDVIVEVETTPKKIRNTPLPLLNWADNEEIWQNIVYKEEATVKLRNVHIFDTRSTYLPRMRAILLDWIMEVCEVYHLRRNTYYLAVDYIDRYLTIKANVPKTQLQLLGVACLFVAAKLEEIYPPKLSEFSYVCDGACTEEEILSCEILLLNALAWEVNPLTPSGWLNLYMQIHHNAKDLVSKKVTLNVDQHFQYPQYSGYQFVRASHLMDLFSMDLSYLRYSYSTIAAAAIFYIYGKEAALAVSGLKWKNLNTCVSYMSVFDRIIKNAVDPRLSTVVPDVEDERLSSTIRSIRRSVPKIISDENHCVQTHLMDLDYFEKSIVLRIQQLGVKVGKVYIKKVTTDDGETEYETVDQCPEDETQTPTVVMYQVHPTKENKRANDIEDLPPLHPTDPDYELGKVNIFNVTQETVVTFDDILASIHNDVPHMKLKSTMVS